MKAIAILIPTRERAHKVSAMHAQWFEVTDPAVATDCVLVLDEDNAETYPRLEGFRYIVLPSAVAGARGMTAPLNAAAAAVCEEYEFLGFWGDDHFPLTPGWNKIMYDRLRAQGPLAMAYGNDLLAGEGLATAVLMDAAYVRELGHMAHPSLQHLYVDNYWMWLARELGGLSYVPQVVIEHRHCSAGKAPSDDMYRALNSSEMFERDRAAYEALVNGAFGKELAQLRTYQESHSTSL